MNNSDDDSWMDLLIELSKEILKAGIWIVLGVFMLAMMYFKITYT
ncbi:hypothetical protein GCM10011365_07180 [Marinicella pacifica]|uniref:Uncharacterized protein n=1 Tax=Marinicella pacifica TaxID=1171543 RepID=A0A917CI98_9GAMM|nr:hypothetical protein [Marinicella pacifica]GGF88589.1 hypothetical protein GCM10011365_07180 [Marinicella pacifica]